VNNEDVLLATSTAGGVPGSWTAPRSIQTPGDRGLYVAPAIYPTGGSVWVVYNAFTTPFRNDTTSPRGLVGVVMQASVGAGGPVGSFITVHRGATGDPRGSSQNDLVLEFLGDYVYAVAGNSYATAVWNDVRDAAVCAAISAYRASVQGGCRCHGPGAAAGLPGHVR
jgi:hypothetical protein